MVRAITITTLRKVLEHDRAPLRAIRQLVEAQPPPWPAPPSVPQLPLWETLGERETPWPRCPRHLLRYSCLGCGTAVRVKRTYCRRCQKRLEAGLPVDLDEYLTDSEYRQLSKRMPGTFVVGNEKR